MVNEYKLVSHEKIKIALEGSTKLDPLDISPIGNLLYLQEMYKKESKLDDNFPQSIQKLIKDNGMFLIELDLDINNSLNFLFDHEDKQILDKALNPKLDPKHSINLFALKRFQETYDEIGLLEKYLEDLS